MNTTLSAEELNIPQYHLDRLKSFPLAYEIVEGNAGLMKVKCPIHGTTKNIRDSDIWNDTAVFCLKCQPKPIRMGLSSKIPRIEAYYQNHPIYELLSIDRFYTKGRGRVRCKIHNEVMERSIDALSEFTTVCKQCQSEAFSIRAFREMIESLRCMFPKFDFTHAVKCNNNITYVCPDHGPQNRNIYKLKRGITCCPPDMTEVTLSDIRKGFTPYSQDFQIVDDLHLPLSRPLIVECRGCTRRQAWFYLDELTCDHPQMSWIDQFIESSKVTWDSNYKYFDFLTPDVRIGMVCPDHGIFFQRAEEHLKRGCPKCL